MWIYNKQNNSVDEQPTMKKPDFYKWSSGVDVTPFMELVDEYEKHLTTLKSYPVSGTHSWEDKQEVVKLKDYILKYQVMVNSKWISTYKDIFDLWDGEKRIAAIPLPVIKQESETRDEIWIQALKEIGAYHGISSNDTIKYLKETFNLTRKTQ